MSSINCVNLSQKPTQTEPVTDLVEEQDEALVGTRVLHRLLDHLRATTERVSSVENLQDDVSSSNHLKNS